MARLRAIPFCLFVAILAILPEARALLFTGFAGGIVVGLGLIALRHYGGPGGPRRGTPIVLFPRPVVVVRTATAHP
jgi:hypothetical protein